MCSTRSRRRPTVWTATTLKAKFGDQLAFHGAIEGMEGSLDDLVAEVRERINVLGKNGGYVMASCNHMIDVPPENIIAMYRDCPRIPPMARVRRHSF
jgi:hypothetical protein